MLPRSLCLAAACVLWALLLRPSLLAANPAFFPGDAEPLGDAACPVRMVWETVRMDVYPRYHTVQGSYLLEGPPQGCSVRFGFPWDAGGEQTDGLMSDYAASADGWPLPSAVRPNGPLAFGQWHQVSTLRFAPGQRRLLRIRYRCESDEPLAWGGVTAHYSFTGRSWRGRVDRSDLTAVFHCPGTWRVLPGYWPAPAFSCWHGNRFFARWRNWEAEGSVLFRYYRTTPGELWLQVADIVPDDVAKSCVVVLPGAAPAGQWQPEYVLRGATVFAALPALGRHFDDSGSVGEQRRPSNVRWDAAGKLGTLVLPDGRALAFRPGVAEMRVDGGTVPLPAPPFLEDGLYVPLQPVLDLVGQRFILYREARYLRIVPPLVPPDPPGDGAPSRKLL